MRQRLALFTMVALVASCNGTPSTTKPTKSTSPHVNASPQDSTSPSASPKASPQASPTSSPVASPSSSPTASPKASPSPSPTATAGTSANAAASLSVTIDGVAVTIAPTFEYGGSGKTTQWILDKPSGFAPAEKWYFDVGVNGKTTKPVKAGFTVDDVSSVALDFRQGTGPTGPERVYSSALIPVTAITIADGKLDLAYKGTIDKLGFGAGGPGGPDKITVDVTVKGLPLP